MSPIMYAIKQLLRSDLSVKRTRWAGICKRISKNLFKTPASTISKLYKTVDSMYKYKMIIIVRIIIINRLCARIRSMFPRRLDINCSLMGHQWAQPD